MIAKNMAHFLRLYVIIMLTRREVLVQLKRMGVEKPSTLKTYLRDFEKYIFINYGLNVIRTKEQQKLSGSNPAEFKKKWALEREKVGDYNSKLPQLRIEKITHNHKHFLITGQRSRGSSPDLL